MKPGDQVQVKPKAEHVFDSFRNELAVVLEVRKIGDRAWAHLSFAELGRETWLPTSRLDVVEEGARR